MKMHKFISKNFLKFQQEILAWDKKDEWKSYFWLKY